MKPVKEIIDLGRELYNGMPNVGGLQIAFWPVETFDQLEKQTGGKYAQERSYGAGGGGRGTFIVPTNRWRLPRGPSQ